jgi:hypothetical protein
MSELLTILYQSSWSILGLILLVVYTFMIVHIRRGNKNTWLTMMCVILMANNIGGVIVGLSSYELRIKRSSLPLYPVLLGVGLALDYGGFSISHYLLSVKYSRMAKNVPMLLEGKPEPQPTKFEIIKHRVMVLLNTIAGPLNGLTA